MQLFGTIKKAEKAAAVKAAAAAVVKSTVDFVFVDELHVGERKETNFAP